MAKNAPSPPPPAHPEGTPPAAASGASSGPDAESGGQSSLAAPPAAQSVLSENPPHLGDMTRASSPAGLWPPGNREPVPPPSPAMPPSVHAASVRPVVGPDPARSVMNDGPEVCVIKPDPTTNVGDDVPVVRFHWAGIVQGKRVEISAGSPVAGIPRDLLEIVRHTRGAIIAPRGPKQPQNPFQR